MTVGGCQIVNVLGKRRQNDVIGRRLSRSQKDGSQRVLNGECSWKMNIVEKLLHSVI